MSKHKCIGHWLSIIFLWLYTVCCIAIIVMVWRPGAFGVRAYKYLGIIGVWGLKIITTLVFPLWWFIGILCIGDELEKLGLIHHEESQNG